MPIDGTEVPNRQLTARTAPDRHGAEIERGSIDLERRLVCAELDRGDTELGERSAPSLAMISFRTNVPDPRMPSTNRSEMSLQPDGGSVAEISASRSSVSRSTGRRTSLRNERTTALDTERPSAPTSSVTKLSLLGRPSKALGSSAERRTAPPSTRKPSDHARIPSSREPGWNRARATSDLFAPGGPLVDGAASKMNAAEPAPEERTRSSPE